VTITLQYGSTQQLDPTLQIGIYQDFVAAQAPILIVALPCTTNPCTVSYKILQANLLTVPGQFVIGIKSSTIRIGAAASFDGY
jgi:hypothetical protein